MFVCVDPYTGVKRDLSMNTGGVNALLSLDTYDDLLAADWWAMEEGE